MKDQNNILLMPSSEFIGADGRVYGKMEK